MTLNEWQDRVAELLGLDPNGKAIEDVLDLYVEMPDGGLYSGNYNWWFLGGTPEHFAEGVKMIPTAGGN